MGPRGVAPINRLRVTLVCHTEWGERGPAGRAAAAGWRGTRFRRPGFRWGLVLLVLVLLVLVLLVLVLRPLLLPLLLSQQLVAG